MHGILGALRPSRGLSKAVVPVHSRSHQSKQLSPDERRHGQGGHGQDDQDVILPKRLTHLGRVRSTTTMMSAARTIRSRQGRAQRP